MTWCTYELTLNSKLVKLVPLRSAKYESLLTALTNVIVCKNAGKMTIK